MRIIQIKKPRFTFSWAFFYLPHHPTMILHRTLFFLSIKKPRDLLVNLIGFIRWMTYYAWKTCYSACKTRTPEQLAQYGLSRHALFWSLLKQSLLHMITPQQYFKYHFYTEKQRSLRFHYVYMHQLPYFHDLSNQHFKPFQQAQRLMGNKDQFAAALEKIGIPVVRGDCYNATELTNNMAVFFQKKPIFCKPNVGSHSQDAFLIAYDETQDAYQLDPIQGAMIPTRPEIERYILSALSRNKQMLIQPFLTDHDAIKALNPSRASTTVRIITAKLNADASEPPVLLYLQLEIPLEKKDAKHAPLHQYYTILPLDRTTLDIDRVFQKKYPHAKHQDVMISDLLKAQLNTGIAHCIHAHHQLLDVRSVAFDIILSDQGAVIVEANYNWSVEMLYSVIEGDPLTSSHMAAIWLQSMFYRGKTPAIVQRCESLKCAP